MNSILFEPSDPSPELLDLNSFLRSQGVNPKKVDGEKYFQKMPYFEEMRQEAQRLIQPRSILQFRPVQRAAVDEILLQGGEALRSSLLASLLGSAAELVFTVSTIGEILERRVEEYFAAGDVSRAFALDGWGTSALVSLGKKLYRHLQAMAEERQTALSISFSPGHNEWPLEQQEVLFRILPADQIGVRLTSSWVMVPKKSTSFMAGLGRDLKMEGSKCDYCPRKKECLFSAEC